MFVITSKGMYSLEVDGEKIRARVFAKKDSGKDPRLTIRGFSIGWYRSLSSVWERIND